MNRVNQADVNAIAGKSTRVSGDGAAIHLPEAVAGAGHLTPVSDIRSATPEELSALMRELGEPAFRAGQIFEWIHKRGAEAYEAMTDIPAKLRVRLAEQYPLFPLTLADKSASEAGDAVKYLFALEKHTIMVESVLMRHTHGATVCVSTQAGCRMGCRFCASTSGGLIRNLTGGEMCAQVYSVWRETGARVDNVVMMGCGEPLDNYGASLRFITLITHPNGQSVGQRHITLSTCGLVPRIYALADAGLQITLAVSLHASDDETRRSLMPVARKYVIKDLLEACAYFTRKTGRRVTYEYALIDHVNDSDAHARALARLLRGTLCHVNLLPVNETASGFRQSRRVGLFARALEAGGVNVTVRRSLGRDINAACGQLRSRYTDTVVSLENNRKTRR